MPLRDILAAALSGPASTVVEGPVRTIVHEVLQDHGYASPAELQAVRDELSALSRRVGELSGVLEESGRKAAALEGKVAELQAQLGRAESAMVEAVAEAAEAVKRAEVAEQDAMDARAAAQQGAAAAAPPAAPEQLPTSVRLVQSPCKVEGCNHYAQTLGFCLNHLQAWQAGRLAGFVGPEGLVDVDGEAFVVGPEHVAQPYAIVGKKSRRVQVDGTIVKKSRV